MWGLLVRFAVMVLFGDNPPLQPLHSYVRLTGIVIRPVKAGHARLC